MTLAPGAVLGPYEIQSRIGAGGMGTVYKARDTRLDRTVAIKTINPEFAERFQREAKAIAALNHPHICQLYDVGENYLVMEYVEGKQIRGPLPLHDLLRLAKQIAEGLAAAHAGQIMHRDLKPANILVAKPGVKILDFGLAKLAKSTEETLTMPGTVMGTLAYMAPEQHAGEETDARTDIFAFGAVLYELATGEKAFQGSAEDTRKTLAPASVDRIVRKCLARDPEDRWQTAGDLREALEFVTEAAPAETGNRGATPWKWVSIAAILTLSAALGAGLLLWPKTPAPPAPVVFEIQPPAGSTAVLDLLVSPDGRVLAIRWNPGPLLLRSLDSESARPLPGTEGTRPIAWSSDARSLLLNRGRKMARFDIATGVSTELAEIQSGGGVNFADWDESGVILFNHRDETIHRISAAGGPSIPVTRLKKGQFRHMRPQFLAGGRRFLYYSPIEGSIRGDWLVKPLDSPAGDPSQRLYEGSGGDFLVHGNPSYLMRITGGNLMAQRMNQDTGALEGEPFTLVSEVASASIESDVLAYRSSAQPLSRHVWYSLDGKVIGEAGENREHGFGGALSPEGTQLAVPVGSRRGADLWLTNLSQGRTSRFTFHGSEVSAPVWSPDGKSIAFHLANGIYIKLSSGAGTEERVLEAANLYPTDWSRDGRFLAYTHLSSGPDIMILDMAQPRTSFPFVKSEFAELNGKFSPDGKWVAYQSNESGMFEVFVRDFTGGPGASKGTWQISLNGGFSPQWRSDGKQLFYMTAGKLMAVEVGAQGDGFVAGKHRELFQLPGSSLIGVSRDGKRFLMQVPERVGAQPIKVVVNWRSLLTKSATGEEGTK